MLCEVSTGARLTCVGVWLDSAVGSGAGRPPGQEPALVSREQPEGCQEEEDEQEQEQEQCSEPSRKRRGRKAVRGDRLGLAKRRAPMEELEKGHRQPVAGKSPAAPREATETPEERTRKPESRAGSLGAARRKRPKKLGKRDSKARGSSLGTAWRRKGQGV